MQTVWAPFVPLARGFLSGVAKRWAAQQSKLVRLESTTA